MPDFPPLARVQDDLNKSAPILMVRKYRSSTRRLYNEEGRDIITKQILSEEIAHRLFSKFVSRLGHIIQIKQNEDITSEQSVRRSSPLLYAVCCLNGLRFCDQPNLINTSDHRQLYEEVRDMLGQVVLASPLPVEELYALLIMSTFEAAPRPAYEYIESWLLSGICAQQAISTLDFVQILGNLTMGRHQGKDKQYLSLWNNICLVNLRFAVGTGKPTTIPWEHIQHCPSILNHPQASIEDGIILAEILLLSVLCEKPRSSLLLDRDGQSRDLAAWEQRWAHLLSKYPRHQIWVHLLIPRTTTASPKATLLRFCREFAYLMLAMRTLERYRPQNTQKDQKQSAPDGADAPSNDDMNDSDLPIDIFQRYARDHALSMAQIFLEMSASLVEELPKFHYICIAYCLLVLSECTERLRNPLREDIAQTIDDVCRHYSRIIHDLPAAMTVALEKVKLGQGQNIPSKPTRHSTKTRIWAPSFRADQGPIFRGDPDQSFNVPMEGRGLAHPEGSGLSNGDPTSFNSDAEMLSQMNGIDDDMLFAALPTVEDFFENWMTGVGNEDTDFTFLG
ncbi:hypothetical protein LTR96_000225 [Exophiala xenobiotica]|uniref:Transcription factor domain-containing protein n=1 Tax=Vermiconidia calcicola TaxID=1690605 RepID=A0AAV9Q8W1_9PEZI|nr:hypothetical protein LTR96_000225 [Exophiala xenobiotica]KAK5535225.1 hypothetical protein LTR25_006233 [Vermiconidia calcicola]KAK5546726.1 hypothetical protein LTR23_003097 [Chaetothyriales sp. CCFEE 6169]